MKRFSVEIDGRFTRNIAQGLAVMDSSWRESAISAAYAHKNYARRALLPGFQVQKPVNLHDRMGALASQVEGTSPRSKKDNAWLYRSSYRNLIIARNEI